MMRSLSARLLAGVLLLATVSAAQSPADRARARELAQQADEKVASHQLPEAISLFQQADALIPAPTLKLAIARLEARLGKLVEAYIRMGDIARSAPVALEPASWTRARADAQTEAAALEPRLATLEVRLSGPPADAHPRLLLDGQEMTSALGAPRVVNPGPHTVRAELEGFRPEERRVELAEGQRLKLTLLLAKEAAPTPPPTSSVDSAPAPRASSSSRSRLAPSAPSTPTPEPARETRANQALLWGGVGVTALFSIVGLTTGILAQSKASDIKQRCPLDRCPPSMRDEVDRARVVANLSTASFLIAGGGVGLAALGLVLREEVPATQGQAAVQVRLGLGSVDVRGSF